MNIFDKMKQMITPRDLSISSGEISQAIRIHNWDSDGHTYELRDPAFADLYSKWRNGVSITQVQFQAISSATAEAQITNRNGYVREFALGILVHQKNYLSICFVTGRMNDYVDRIRRLATKTVALWLSEADLSLIVNTLPTLYALKKQSRADSTLVLDIALARLFEPLNHPHLLMGIESKNHKVSAICWQLAGDHFEWTSFEKISFALKSKDTVTQSRVSTEVAHLSDQELTVLFKLLNKIKVMQLRREILLAVTRRKLYDEDECINHALWDKSYSIRWMARLWAKEEPEFLYEEYRKKIETPASIRGTLFALEGIQELGDKRGITILKDALHQPHSSVKRSALFKLCDIDKAHLTDYLDQFLEDTDLRMVKACFNISFRECRYFSVERLTNLIADRKSKKELFSILLNYAAQISGWHGLDIAALCQYAKADIAPLIKLELHSFLRRWAYSEIYVCTTINQFIRIRLWLTDDKLKELNGLGEQLKFAFKTQESKLTS